MAVKVFVYKQSSYPVSNVKIKKRLSSFLVKKGLVSDVEVSVAIVGKEKMYKLAEIHLKEKNSLHNVLSFTNAEVTGRFKYPEGIPNQLGEIVVCFPKVIEEAKVENKLLEDKLIELVEHGAMHLMGYHHK